jgi:ribonucleoside-triphosphate reductase
MARLGFRFKGNKAALIKDVERLMDLAKSSLEKKRVFIQEMYDRGLYPYTKRYLPGFRSHFSTIGVNGMNEMIRNFSNDAYDVSDPRGMELPKFWNLKQKENLPEETAISTSKPRQQRAQPIRQGR